ncbi:MAG TPA: nickel pincer cofactor biosynthesis protein LarB [Chthonomonadales bacterium]|nr:nickel pincer cofactor biosynthesis protein LarB [Chthonomonadales bacterium]
MNEDRLRGLLDDIRSGRVDIEEGLLALRDLPYENLGYARVDHHRALRTGVPEVILCTGKTSEQVVGIARSINARGTRAVATRASADVASALRDAFPQMEYHAVARVAVVPAPAPEEAPPAATRGVVLVIAAGTADLPVAEEAAVIAGLLGSPVERLYDVGVAGLHRLLDHREALWSASVLVVVAGMEGALPSVVGGLVSRPVIGVPTSVGYGAQFSGLAPLLTMLNSCASGIAVVNIDNGFGAGYLAHLINSV